MVTMLRLEPFANSLCKKSAANLDELRRRAAKFMNLKNFEFQSQVYTKGNSERPKEKRENRNATTIWQANGKSIAETASLYLVECRSESNSRRGSKHRANPYSLEGANTVKH